MNSAIVIAHQRSTSPWLNDLLNSIETTYPVIVSNHEGWVMDSIRLAFENTPFDEIFFLNTSMVVKDNSIWDLVFKTHAGRSVAVGDKFLMHLGKYRREIADRVPYPKINGKLDEVTLGEFGWTREYIKLEPNYVTIDPMTDTFEAFEEKHGRRNMILENQYFKKWKATWHTDMIK